MTDLLARFPEALGREVREKTNEFEYGSLLVKAQYGRDHVIFDRVVDCRREIVRLIAAPKLRYEFQIDILSQRIRRPSVVPEFRSYPLQGDMIMHMSLPRNFSS